MIRILHVVTYMGRGGLETVLMNYYRNIDRSVVQFDFLTHRDFKADYDDEIESLGGKIYHLPRLVPWSRSYKRELDNFFKCHPEYKIIHVHQDCLSSVILKVAKRNNIKVRIAHSHNNNQDFNLKYPIKLYYKKDIANFATGLFACSLEAGRWMFKTNNFKILRNAIKTIKYSYNYKTRSDLRKSLSIPEDHLIIGHVGRFQDQKNHSFIIDIFYQIIKKEPTAHLILVGDGTGRNPIEEKVNKLGLTDSVIFTGVRSDVNDLLQAMDVFLMPSKYEGLGLACIEAQASGLPCYISDTVSEECNVTDLVYRLSLKDSPEKWAEAIISGKRIERTDTTEMIIKSGYDITENAKWLQSHYIKLWNENLK